MKILGLDPSLTGFGWCVLDMHQPNSVLDRGHFTTTNDDLFLLRYVSQRESLKQVLSKHKDIQFVGLESPVFGAQYSEGMYGLFLFACEALYSMNTDVVLFSPLQAKAQARAALKRPSNWEMRKIDMIEAASTVSGIKKWDNNEADAFWIATLASRFWRFFNGEITREELSTSERDLFAKSHTYTRGKKKGTTENSGLIHRENDRFFRWSKTKEDSNGPT